tara:strand:- start:463 stop:912 length:450 start_codon:yes stop_codon:yes gene_type:complete
MATLVELKAKAKKMGYKGYSKMKKAELEKLLTTPPPKPPRTKSKAEQAKNPVRQVRKAKKEPKKKLLSKRALIEEIEDDENNDMSSNQLDDHYADYRNDYPQVAQTDRQMERLAGYSTRQINKQVYDYYKKNKGSLKGFKVKNIYGKAF